MPLIRWISYIDNRYVVRDYDPPPEIPATKFIEYSAYEAAILKRDELQQKYNFRGECIIGMEKQGATMYDEILKERDEALAILNNIAIIGGGSKAWTKDFYAEVMVMVREALK